MNVRGFVKRLRKKSSIMDVLYYCAKTLYGYLFYRSLKKEFGKNSRVFLLPWEGTGDAYYFAQCFWQDMKTDDIVLDASEPGIKVLKMLGIQNCIKISLYQRRALLLFSSLIGGAAKDIIVPHYASGLWTNSIAALEGINGLTYRDFYELIGYSFYPAIARSGPYDEETVIRYCKSLGIITGKTVIIAPYASSCPSPKIEEWQRLVRELQNNGLKVVTNASDKEQAIPGTTAVQIPYDMLLPVLDTAGYFVGIRSGLCDVIAGSTCKKVILYPKMKYKQGTYYSFYDLSVFPQRGSMLMQKEFIEGQIDEEILREICGYCIKNT